MKSSHAIILGMAAAAMFSLGALAQESRSGTISRIDPAKGTMIAAMVRAILASWPTLPLEPVARELALRVLLSQTRDEARRLLAVICN